MRNRFLFLFNIVVALATGILLFAHFASSANSAQVTTLPGAAA